MKSKYWSPYLAGTGIGVLALIMTYPFHLKMTVSSGFVHIAGAIEELFIPNHFFSNTYFMENAHAYSLHNWTVFFLLGIFLGSFLASYFSKTRMSGIPSVWKKRFGSSKNFRNLWAFVGGMFVLFGARLAGGCMTGHGISGGMRLAVSSLTFVIVAFSAAILTASLIYQTSLHRK